MCAWLFRRVFRLALEYVYDTYMQRKLTITIDENVYAGLHRRVGQGHISQFIESLVRPHVMAEDLIRDYEEMAADEAREQEALEWAEALIADVADEPR